MEFRGLDETPPKIYNKDITPPHRESASPTSICGVFLLEENMTNELAFICSLGSQNYLPVNRTLMAALGINQAIYLSELCNYYVYFASRGMLDDEGLFYVTHDMIQRRTTLTGKQQRACEAELREKNILAVSRKGMPARNWYKINSSVLAELVMTTNVEFSAEIEENDDLQFAQMGNQDVTKGNDKMLQKVTTATIYYNNENRINENRLPCDSPSVGQTGEDSFEDVLSPSTRKGKQRRKQFTPPSLEEVKAYCKEKELSVDAEFFYNYYTKTDWIDSKGEPVRNWKSKAITWSLKNKDKVAPAPKVSEEALPENYISACEKLGLFEWKNLTEYSSAIWELARWSRDRRNDEKFMLENSDVYGVFSHPEEFWKSYLAFVCDMIGGTKPREGHFRLRGKTFMCWYDEMEIKGGI